MFKVSDVWGNWPVEIKNHANGLKLSSAQVAIPFEMVEPGLRSGKIEFSWADFCYWIQNCPAGAELPPDTRVALPLPVMAPLCLRLSPPTQRRAENLEHIPDIFGPSGQKADDEEEEEDEAPVFQKAPAPAQRPVATPPRAPTPPPQPTYTPAAPAPVPLPATASGPDPGLAAKNLADLFGEAGKRNWTPNEMQTVQGKLFSYGVGYGAAGFGCVAPPFIAAILNATVIGGAGAGIAVLGVYAGVVIGLMAAITIVLATVGQAAVKKMNRYTEVIKRISAVVLIAAGAYLIYYWYSAWVA